MWMARPLQLLLLLLASPLRVGATLPTMSHTVVPVPATAQMKPGCATKELGVTVRGVHYFLPTAGSSPNIVTYTPATKVWGSLPITGVGEGIVKSLDGCTMSGVEAPHAGLDDYLVFGGGTGSNRVTQFNLNTKMWNLQKPLSHVTTNLCSSGCLGYAFFATGDFKAATPADQIQMVNASDDATFLSKTLFKPADRQIQRYNLTSGEMEENNMEKTRAGAVCACYSKGASTNYTGPGGNAPRVFFAGGQDDAGATDTVEMWLPGPDIKRRGEPEFAMSFSGRDRGGLVCGGRLVLAGGRSGVGQFEAETEDSNRQRITSTRRRSSPPKPKPKPPSLSDLVDVWMANATGPVSATRTRGGATGSPGVKPQQVYKLSEAVRLPKVVCLAERYVVIAGGHPAKGCFSSAMHLLDLDAPPASGSSLPLLPFTLNSTTSTFAAVAFNNSAMFFNGVGAEVLKIEG